MADLRGRAIMALVTYLFVIGIIGFLGQASLVQLIVGFGPSLLFITFIYSAYHVLHRQLITLLPIALSVFFILFGFLGTPIIEPMEFVILGVVNLLLCYGMLAFLQDVFPVREDHLHHPHYYTPQMKQVPKDEEPKHKVPKTVEQSMQSIVANCKALNHVIGRVYSKSHGGSDQLRERIRIPPEVYHQIEESLAQNDREHAKQLLDYLRQKIGLFTQQERAVFGSVQLKGISRDPHGLNTVEQILIHNDADPVHDYLKSIRESIKVLEKKISQ